MPELKNEILKHSYPLLIARRIVFFLMIGLYLIFSILLSGIFISMILSIIFPHSFVHGTKLLWTLLGGLGVLIITSLFDLLFQAKNMDAYFKIYNQNPDDPETTEVLHNLQKLIDAWKVEGFIRYGARIYASEHPEMYMNAITYTSIDYPRIVISKDLIQQLDVEEVAAVVGHELGHINYRDTFFKTILYHITKAMEKLLWPFSFMLNLARFLVRLIRSFLRGSFGIIVSLFVYVLFFPILLPGLLFWMPLATFNWFCHFQEYLADDFSAHLIGDSTLLINALMSIEDMALGKIEKKKKRFLGTGDVARYKRYFTILYDHEYKKPEFLIGEIWYFFQALSETHPPSIERWTRLAKIGFLIDQEQLNVA